MATTKLHAVLDEAIEDLAERGGDDINRIKQWQERIEKAAEESMTSARELKEMLEEAYRAVYDRVLSSGNVLRRHPGIELFTLDKVKPKLHGEVQRRVLQAADLITLNRSEMIDATLRRFSGWASSVPAGGQPKYRAKPARDVIRKGIAGLPFTERRVIVDQGHKLYSSLSETLATDGDAIAGRWRSNWRQPGYHFREDHKERDEQIYFVRDSWALKDGLVRRNGAPFTDQITKPGEEPYCRCWYVWIYNLRDLPDDYLTDKGRRALEAAQVQ